MPVLERIMNFGRIPDGRYDFILNSQGGGSIMRHYDRLGPTGRIVCWVCQRESGGGAILAIAKAAIQCRDYVIDVRSK